MAGNWQPSASLDIVRYRAGIMAGIRRFMEERNIMEVETPVLSHSANTDPNLYSFKTLLHTPAASGAVPLFLNTSPEFAMKRLLAAGSGSIYQLARVFRDGESGRFHEPEFTLLEWYRIGFNHHQLMDEMVELMNLLGYESVDRKSYAEVFETCTGQNPHLAGYRQLHDKAVCLGLHDKDLDRNSVLDFLFSHSVAPALRGPRPVLIYDFPVCQAALARIRPGQPAVAERFELFIDGLEIANGFHELCDAREQRQRFEHENHRRRQQGLNQMPLDEYLLEALEQGLPACAGVAMGLDRLLMQLSGADSLADVMTFSHDRT